METSLNAEVNQYNNVMGDLVKSGLKQGAGALKNFSIGADGVKAARNFIMPILKFKPWGAVNLAKNLSTTLPIIGNIIGIGFEVLDSYSKQKQEQEFRSGIKMMVSNFEQQRKEYLESINDESTFIQNYFPKYIELQNRIQELDEEMHQKRQQPEQFQQWRQHGEIIETEFEDIS
jgi:hypothetical protein